MIRQKINNPSRCLPRFLPHSINYIIKVNAYELIKLHRVMKALYISVCVMHKSYTLYTVHADVRIIIIVINLHDLIN